MNFIDSENSQWVASSIISEAAMVAREQTQFHVLMRPSLTIDGNQWCALYGDNLQDGVGGFGDSPYRAMLDFDKNWITPIGSNALKDGE